MAAGARRSYWFGLGLLLVIGALTWWQSGTAQRDEVATLAALTELPPPPPPEIPALASREFADGAALARWQDQQRARLREVYAYDPRPADLPLVSGRRRLDAPPGLVRESLLFLATDGTPVPAILQYPDHGRPAAAILVLPGHTRAHQSGLYQLVYGLDSYQRAAATRLAQAGFVTLAFELRGFGLLGLRAGGEHNPVAYNALQAGRFYKALIMDDARVALALLRSEPQVDVTRLGVTGASLGGELAVTLGALDPALTAVAYSSFGGDLGAYPAAGGRDERPLHYCHVVPGAWRFLRREDPALLLAPRPTLGVRDDRHTDDDYVSTLAAAWRQLGAAEGFRFESVAEGAHVFYVEQTVAFFRRALGDGAAGKSAGGAAANGQDG